jgi:hypothetical protein
MAQLRLTNVCGYRQACKVLLGRFRETADPVIMHQVVNACVLRPDALDEWGVVLKLANKAADAERRNFFSRLDRGAGEGQGSRGSQLLDVMFIGR